METRLIRGDVIQLLCDFLETWIHEILYQRKIYPAQIFTLKKKFQVGIHIAEFPSLSEYISSFVESCLPLFEQVKKKKE
ncbi:hypothetical protein K501DRAFT_27778 [Backusella circina FSU 941]|nr:hypothetical protein K501DRAFT_27778 [Backusella circina FSU 941]